MKSMILRSVLVFTVFAQSHADAACVDGRLVRIDCSRDKKVLTHYGCEEEYFVQCLPLAEIPLFEGVTSGGFRRDPQIDMTSVMRDGTVVQTQKIMDRRTQKWTVKSAETLTLKASLMSKINEHVSVLTVAEYWPSAEPMCADAPDTQFTAYVSKQGESPEAIEYFKIEACREMSTKSPGALELRYISKSLDSLSSAVFQ